MAYAGMFVFGIVMAILGAILPLLAQRLRFDLADVGALFLVMNFSMLVCCLVLGLAMDRFGMQLEFVAGPAAVAAGLVVILSAARLSTLGIGVALLGIGGGALNGATNTLVADLHADAMRKNAALNLLGVFFGIGALLLPLTIGALLATLSLNGILGSAALLCLLVSMYALSLRFPAPKQVNRLPIVDMPRFLRSPAVLGMAALLFFQSGNEFMLGGYLSTFLTRELAVSVSSASWLLAAYWASILVARVFLSSILLKVDGAIAVITSAAVAVAGALLIMGSRNATVASIGIVATGLAVAGIFPTVLGMAGARFRDHSGTVFGILLTFSLTGGMLMPWLAGNLAQSLGLRQVFAIVSANSAAIFLIQIALRRFIKPAAAQ